MRRGLSGLGFRFGGLGSGVQGSLARFLGLYDFMIYVRWLEVASLGLGCRIWRPILCWFVGKGLSNAASSPVYMSL